MFPKILIANRGEVAVRIIRACKDMGISTVAVFSEADRDALHVSLADESICIGSSYAKDSYLNIPAILSAAIYTGANAIHPGYGFLAESAKFAQLCEQCNITFIGPTHQVISLMGNKDTAKDTLKQAGIPVIPGCGTLTDPEQALAVAKEIGFPLLIKARAGGGGRGIRRVDRIEEFPGAFLSATKEALAAFGDSTMYIEKLLLDVRHVEMQVLCDNFGNIVCLGERECSVQRRNQKLIEESPCPAVSEQTRQKMIQAAKAIVKTVRYTNAGTVEFLLDSEENFYFIEMNTRLQVEHSVTEMVTGIDIVKWQIRIAANYPLSFTQQDVNFKGHAIECRINAENPYEGFKPSCGNITLLHIPGGPWVRFDTAIYQNYFISPYYDSMIGKVIVYAWDREEAIRKMQSALCELVIEGIEHNSEFLLEILADETFVSGKYNTDFLDRYIRKYRGNQ